MSETGLNIEQQAAARSLFREKRDILDIAKEVFKNPTLDKRSAEFRKIRRFLGGLPPDSPTPAPRVPPRGPVELNEEQKRFIEQNYKEQNLVSLGKTLFPEKAPFLTPLHGECKAIRLYIQHVDATFYQDMRGALETYRPPKDLPDLCKLVTQAANVELNPDRISTADRNCLKHLAHNLSSDRFRSCMDQLNTERERDIFESEFVRATWDKPDLTPDEVNLYINLCDEYINRDRISRKYAKLDEAFFEEKDAKNEMSMRLSEMIKAVSAERDQAAKRIESLINKLNGDRAKRLKEKGSRTVSITAAFEAFKSEEERRQMLRIAQVQREAIREEQKRLEGMPAWMARVLGVGKEYFE